MESVKQVLGIAWLVVCLLLFSGRAQAGELPPCSWWEDQTQEERNERIAWEAVRLLVTSEGEGFSKNFVKQVLLRASGGAATLPPYTYNYAGWFQEVDAGDVQTGHVLQMLSPQVHTAIIVRAWSKNEVEVIDTNANGRGRKRRHIIRLDSADVKFAIYAIGTGMCAPEDRTVSLAD